jgi:hypothetical protein
MVKKKKKKNKKMKNTPKDVRKTDRVKKKMKQPYQQRKKKKIKNKRPRALRTGRKFSYSFKQPLAKQECTLIGKRVQSSGDSVSRYQKQKPWYKKKNKKNENTPKDVRKTDRVKKKMKATVPTA